MAKQRGIMAGASKTNIIEIGHLFETVLGISLKKIIMTSSMSLC